MSDSSARRAPPVPPVIRNIAAPFYAVGLAHNTRKYDKGKGVRSAPIPVISVGSLNLGGAGKTPMVCEIVRMLRAAQHRPCVAMRGYGKAGQTGAHSDEARVYARAAPETPVVAQPERLDGILALLASQRGRRVTCAVLDDGFQHRRLARDFDIALIDASNPPFRDRLFPLGHLRERPAALRRADATVITHAEMVSPAQLSEVEQWLKTMRSPAIAVTRHHWTRLIVASPRHDGSLHEDSEPVSWLSRKKCLVVCGIGSPEGFLAGAANAIGPDAEPMGRLRPIVLPDHDPYAPSTVQRILDAAKGAEAILTTEKDWVKLADARGVTWPCPVVRPALTLAFDRGEGEFQKALLAACVRRQGEPD